MKGYLKINLIISEFIKNWEFLPVIFKAVFLCLMLMVEGG